MSVNSAVFSNLQSINPSAIIELFTLTLQNKLHYDPWEANKAYTVGNIVDSDSSNAGVVFKCTVAGTSGSSQPSAFGSASIGQTVTDNQITWTAQSVDIFRFHSGSSLKANGQIVWDGDSYFRFPIQASGFAFQRGQLPRPKLIISNAGLNTISSAVDNFSVSAILNEVNKITPGNDLTGSTVTRIRTLAKFLDAENFEEGNANADPTAEFPKEIYKIDRKSVENREVVEFELAAPTDLAGVRIPGRRATRNDFPSIGTFIQ